MLNENTYTYYIWKLRVSKASAWDLWIGNYETFLKQKEYFILKLGFKTPICILNTSKPIPIDRLVLLLRCTDDFKIIHLHNLVASDFKEYQNILT